MATVVLGGALLSPKQRLHSRYRQRRLVKRPGWGVQPAGSEDPSTCHMCFFSGRGCLESKELDATLHYLVSNYSLGLLAHILRRWLDPPSPPQPSSQEVVGALGIAFQGLLKLQYPQTSNIRLGLNVEAWLHYDCHWRNLDNGKQRNHDTVG